VREVAEAAVLADLLSSIQRTRLTVYQPRARDSARRILAMAAGGTDPGFG